ncbi:hypothetical protein PIB30_060800 [Stylosanthes scabra]|uniref:leucine--tRNA ligase n=1 Tax=Stylosanthes scabra TaxID=79078 RepID=A0ABU6WKL3_9FABA|nr:hypothetical protein [Stylosanthes scabra]
MAEGNGNCFTRRERLREIEVTVQKWWEEEQVFRAEAGENPPQAGEKFFGNFPFPYMNGYLHLGHAFSLSKLEFAAAFHRLRGANVLLPFSFHCTGMPIKASADKLAREIHQYGDPPVFPKEQEQEKKKKKQVYQWEIMRSVGISNNEIPEFQDPNKWISYFPPLAMEDLKAFGLGCDWRRSFVTTDRNPYFDSFVRWQMKKLKSMGKIVKDMRYTIFCPLDGQPCADHDRASGEGVQSQEYTIVKMEILKPLPKLEGKKVFLACATLRLETMYGQTSAWVLPHGEYGAYEINDNDDVLIMSYKAALNLAYQKYSGLPHKPTCLLHLTGYDLIGLPLKSPLSFNEVIFVLPMSTLSMDKGTGIIASIPSDTPSDSLALQHLMAKYGLKDEWFMPVGVPPLVEGTIHVGEFAGKKVQEARPLIRRKLLEKGIENQ